MDIKQLRTVIHVAELGSLSKASLRLGIAQPALGRQIRMLEEELGAPLFERHGRGMVPTFVGRDVLEHASRVLRELEALRASASPVRSELAGAVAIGTTPTVGEVVTVPLVQRLKRTYPRVSVRISSAFSGHLLDWLKRGDLDFVVVYNPKPSPLLDVVPFMVEELLLVGAGHDGLNLKHPVDFASLADQPLVLPSPAHGLREIVDAHALEAGIKLTATVEADSFSALISLVKHGFGRTLLPLAPIFGAIEAADLCAAPLRHPTPIRQLGIAFSSDRAMSQPARAAAEFLVDITSTMVGEGRWVGKLIRNRYTP